MKKILYLTFYFEPDLCAGSFRNTPLVKELSRQANGRAIIDVFTTLPNRYNSFSVDAPKHEVNDNYSINRISIPKHESGMKDQVFSFTKYYNSILKEVDGRKYDLVVASSSRLFTAYLGYRLAKKFKCRLYLDIRDIFYDTLEDVLKKGVVKFSALPIIKLVERKTFHFASHINLISEGFKPYFDRYKNTSFSYFPNGIDEEFAEMDNNLVVNIEVSSKIKTIVYAGNIGEGQGLHKIIPQAARSLEGKFRFIIIGDGGAKDKLVEQLSTLNVSNVEMISPMKRNDLISVYKNADFLFVHLNNYKAFEKVLPSKIFELAAFSQPLIAGVGGYASTFVKENIENAIVFSPCNVNEFIFKLLNYKYQKVRRKGFIEKFNRDAINRNMAESILKYI